APRPSTAFAVPGYDARTITLARGVAVMPHSTSLESLVHPETLSYIRERAPEPPQTVVVLGSGINLWPDLEDAVSLDYGEIPHMPQSTVVGHSGRLTFGKL